MKDKYPLSGGGLLTVDFTAERDQVQIPVNGSGCTLQLRGPHRA